MESGGYNAAALDAHVTAHALGEVYIAPFDVILADISIVQPDIVFVAKNRLAIPSERGVNGAPTLAVETLSPHTTHIDRTTKLQLYARYGVPYYWIVDPDARVIDVHTLSAGAYNVPERFGGARRADHPPFAGLSLDPSSLWVA